MATSLKSRIIVREHSTSINTWAGTYQLLMRAKSIPSPIQDPNAVESTTLEDGAQTFEMGIFQSGILAPEGNWDKDTMDYLMSLKGKKVDIIHLYGTDGLGSVGKFAYHGEITAKPSDVGGNDEILGLVANIVPNTVPEYITDDYTVTEAAGAFTVTAE